MICVLAAGMVLASLAPKAFAAPVVDWEDIRFWVGTGGQSAGLAIDWKQPETTQTLVWGYRWDGVATAEDMFRAIVAADSRLYARIGSFSGSSIAVFGIGYDASGDGLFVLDDESVVFDSQGIAVTGASSTALSTDPADFYREGWRPNRFWRHATAEDMALAANPAGWSEGPGLSSRILTSGGWDSLAFATTQFDMSTVAEGWTAAELHSVAGDYNRSGVVDAADYSVWRDTVGGPEALLIAGYGADGNRDHAIDVVDYSLWSNAFGDSVMSPLTSVPEPAVPFLGAVACVVLFVRTSTTPGRFAGRAKR